MKTPRHVRAHGAQSDKACLHTRYPGVELERVA